LKKVIEAEAEGELSNQYLHFLLLQDLSFYKKTMPKKSQNKPSTSDVKESQMKASTSGLKRCPKCRQYKTAPHDCVEKLPDEDEATEV
jgi:hypothetical protein